MIRRLLAAVGLVALGLAAPPTAASAPRDPDSPPRIVAEVGQAMQRTGFYTSSWASRQGRRSCVVGISDGAPGDRARQVAPGRHRVRVSLYRALKPAKVRLSTYSRKTGPGEYAGRDRPDFGLRRFRDRRGRPAWRLVFPAELAPGEYLRGEFYVRYPDTDGCGTDEGYGAFTFRAARPRD